MKITGPHSSLGQGGCRVYGRGRASETFVRFLLARWKRGGANLLAGEESGSTMELLPMCYLFAIMILETRAKFLKAVAIPAGFEPATLCLEVLCKTAYPLFRRNNYFARGVRARP